MQIDLTELAKFLVKAKVQAYAGDGAEVPSERPGFRELIFSDGIWQYRDSYSGFFFAPGQEVVRLRDVPVWAMSYSGGMRQKYHGNTDFAKQTFNFLKQALLRVEESRPFRGPNHFSEGKLEYVDASEGDITDFIGTERIIYQGNEVFRQHYIGGFSFNMLRRVTASYGDIDSRRPVS